MPSANVALVNSNFVSEPSASRRRSLAVLNRQTPGIIDIPGLTSIAAIGICRRRAAGVRISPRA